MKNNKQTEFTKLIYISHPYNGSDYNMLRIEDKIIELRKKYKDYLFISPVHTFGYLYNVTTYEEGIDMCLKLLEKCDEVWIISDEYTESKGCLVERSYAHALGIPVFNVEEEELDERI